MPSLLITSGGEVITTHIWIINHYAVPPDEPGGTRHYSLARGLIRHGHQVTILAADLNHWTGKKEADGESRAKGEVPFVRITSPSYQGNGPARFFNMLAFAQRVQSSDVVKGISRPDVILASSPHLFAAGAGYRMARKFRVPFVLEIRDLWPQSLIDVGKISPQHPVVLWMKGLENFLYRRASLIITLLPGVPDYLIKQKVPPQKIIWLPNGVDLEMLPPLSLPENKEYLTVMYAGAHGTANHLEVILQAASILKQQGWEDRICFRFIGDGPLKGFLEAQAREMDLHSFRFEDAVPKSEVYSRLKEADLFVVSMLRSPLYRWGISLNKIYDYLAMGRPIILAAEACNNPVLESGAGITVPPDNPEAMANAIRTIALLSAQERAEMGMRGRKFAEEYHDFQRLAEDLENVLKRVVE